MRAYSIEVNGEQIDLRITIASQIKLSKKYNEPAMSTIFSSVADAGKIIDVFTEALNFKGNSNSIKDGAALYDALVDDGKTGTDDFIEILAGIASESGLVTDEQKEKIVGYTQKQSGEMFNALTGDEKNA